MPPGWSAAKSSLLNPRISNKATAKASPIAKVAVVLAVGARSRVQASFSTDVSRYISDPFAKVEFCRPINPIIVTPFLCIAGRIWINSIVSPLLLTISNTSSLVIMPRSPWVASAGWTKWAGVPVDAMVEAIFCEIKPDFPNPDTIRRPAHSKIV